MYEKYLISNDDTTDSYISVLIESVYNFFDTLDLDNLTESQMDLFEDVLLLTDDPNMIEENSFDESKKIVKVIRNNKRVKKIKCSPGYKALDGKCVKMSSSEKRVRSKASKKGAKKRKSQHASIARKRAKSMKKRA